MYLTRQPIDICDFIADFPAPSLRGGREADAGRSSGGWPLGHPAPRGRRGEAISEIASASFGVLPRNDVHGYKSGASVLFLGIVRNHSEGREVLYLEYEGYEEMAERMLEKLIGAARHEFQVEEIKICHRLGRVDLGEIAVAIEVRSIHRDEAYRASRYLIEEIKHRVPIWKKEYFSDGTSEWSGHSHCEVAKC